jgi:hypothetical protein
MVHTAAPAISVGLVPDDCPSVFLQRDLFYVLVVVERRPIATGQPREWLERIFAVRDTRPLRPSDLAAAFLGLQFSETGWKAPGRTQQVWQYATLSFLQPLS